MSSKAGGTNGRNGYQAGAGLGTTEEDDQLNVAAPRAQAATGTTDPPPNVGEPLNVKTVERVAKSRTVIKAVVFSAGLLILSGLGLWYVLSDGSGKSTVKTNMRNQSRGGQADTVSEEKLTADAIRNARSQLAPTPETPAADATKGTTPAIIVQQGEPVVPTKVGTVNLDAQANTNVASNTAVVRPADGVAGTVNSNTNAANNTQTSSSNRSSGGNGSTYSRSRASRQESKANDQKSLVYGETETRSDADSRSETARDEQSRAINAGFALGASGRHGGEAQNIASRPSFGSLLPVRTLGAIYTLRTGALVRMELTRDVSGSGWKLPRRTVIVGTLRGGEYDRAYITVVGYIDSSSGRLVSFGGALLGSDAGEGIKGERRQVTGRWSRILGTVANKGFDLAQSVIGRRNGATIVLGDAGRPEINALTGNNDRREFIAVKAGSMGYVSVTDLPRDVDGVDALTQMNPDALAQLLNSGANTGTGLGDEEVAQLLSSGSPAQIRAAMPRMNENMRRIAEQAMNQSER